MKYVASTIATPERGQEIGKSNIQCEEPVRVRENVDGMKKRLLKKFVPLIYAAQ